LGMAATLGFDAAQGRLTGSVRRGAQGGKTLQVAPEAVVVHLAHATQPGKDVVLQVTPDANGAFSVALPMLERSRWQVQVEGVDRGWRLEGTWSWPSQRSVTLLADPSLM
jgi:hypothetical protein